MNHPSCILLVDDSVMDVELALDAFREVKLSGNIQVAYNGQQAVDYVLGQGKFADRQTYPLPDVILLDLKMPGIDGFEVLRRLKGKSGLKRLPIVVLTSSREEGDRDLAYDLGANSYLVKPVSFLGFIDMIRSVENYWLSLNVGPPPLPPGADPIQV